MKKLLVTSLLAFATCAYAQGTQQTPATQPGQTTTAQPAGTQPQQKTIKDPAEYNAYMSATSQSTPAAKAQALEAFLQQYPNTVVKEETLEQLMGAYQAAGDAAKMTDAANRLLQVNPNNIRALALLTYSRRLQAAQQTNPQQAASMYAEAAQFAQRGLQAADAMQKPSGVSDADFQKLKTGVLTIFNGSLGMDALQRKDYANAQKYLLAAVREPADANNLQDVYPLATAYLQAPQKDYLNGLWYAARAVDLAGQMNNAAAQQQINQFALYYYKKYHGGEDGWQQVLQQAQTSPNPPEGFTIAKAPPPPTPCQFADQIMQKYNNDVSQMAYGDWLFILGSGNQKDADAVWNFLNGKLIPVTSPEHPGKVISATAEQIVLATTDDDIQENKADVTVKLATPLAASKVPQAGATYNQKLIGKAASYTPIPGNSAATQTEGGAGADQTTSPSTQQSSPQQQTPTTSEQQATPAQQQAPPAEQQQQPAAGQQAPAAGQQAPAAGQQPAAAAQQPAAAPCNSNAGVMLTLTDGKVEGAPARKAPPHRTTRRRH